MWEFLSNLLEKGGVVALLFFTLAAAFAFAIKALWNENQLLRRQIRDDKKTHVAEVRDEAVVHEQKLVDLHERYEKKYEELQKRYEQKFEELQTRYDELQEKRRDEAVKVQERVMTHIQAVDRSSEKISHSLELLINMLGDPNAGKGRGRG